MIESSAAAMAYGLMVAGSKRVLVFDMGGGTTDITIMTIENGSYRIEWTGGSMACGGIDIDDLLLAHVSLYIIYYANLIYS